MKLNIICFLILALGLIAPVSNAATVSTQIVLLDASDTPLPHVGNTYVIPLGTNFRVMLQGQVNNPNFTDTFRTGTTMDNQPLGVAYLLGDIVTSGVNVVNPDEGPPFPSGIRPTWLNFVEYIGRGLPEGVNLNDVDGDGDLDPATAGTANAASTLTNLSQLPFVQLGALGLTNFCEGTYTAVGSGITQLAFIPGFVRIYLDPPAANNLLDTEDGHATFDVGTPLTIIVPLPEPSTYALAGLGLVGLAIAMRRKTAH